jgi:hypothetical protein
VADRAGTVPVIDPSWHREDVVLAQCNALRGCGTIIRIDLRGAADTAAQERWRTLLANGDVPCPQCGRKAVAGVPTIQPQ